MEGREFEESSQEKVEFDGEIHLSILDINFWIAGCIKETYF